MEGAVWERPWSLEEIRRNSQSWSLGADAGLLNFLREFSQQTISRTHDIEKQLDGLVRDAKAADCRLHNVFNDFLMLSNTQFIENRVYDEEIEEHIVKSDPGDKPEPEKTREQKEAELIPKVQEAVNYGLQVLESAFEQLDIKAGNSDSEEEEVNERTELILEPKDLYIDRPLPYLIGSQLFMQQEDVGLGDLSSEDTSVDNDRGSIIDSEEEEEEEKDEDSEDFDNNSEDDKKMRSALSDEDEDNGSDLFGDSDKEDDEENDTSTKTRTKSFADELAARIQGDAINKQEQDRTSISSLEVKPKKEREKKEAKKPLSDEEDDDIFQPPKLTDEDFSPFGSKGGLFSGGRGLFDDDDEGDLFADAEHKENKNEEVNHTSKSEPLPSVIKKKPPIGGVSLFPGGEDLLASSVLAEKEKKKPSPPVVDATQKLPTSSSLFDDDDVLFGGSDAKKSETKATKAKPVSDLFAEDDDLFDNVSSPSTKSNKTKESEGIKPKSLDVTTLKSPVEKSKPPESLAKPTRGLFSDEDDSETDLFSTSETTGKSKDTLSAPKTTKTLSLFDDEDEDLFAPVPDKKPPPFSTKPTQQNSPPEPKDVKSGLFSSDMEDLASISSQEKTEQKQTSKDLVPNPIAKVDKGVKISLFDDEEEEVEDLFAITKESQKKHQRVSLLFEDDISDGSFFSSIASEPAAVGAASDQLKPSVSAKPVVPGGKEPFFVKSKQDVEDKKMEPKTSLGAVLNEEPQSMLNAEKSKAIPAAKQRDYDNEDLFAASPPTDKHSKAKGKNVLSLFEDEEEEGAAVNHSFNRTQNDSRKPPSDKSSHGKSTRVFQDEELLFSDEQQKDNDPDFDLFASTKKQPSEKSNQTKPSSGVGLFNDDEEDDIFNTSKPKKPPKVQEKKTIMKKESLDTSKESAAAPHKEADILKPGDDGDSAARAPVVTKSASSRIGKLQANLNINPATMLPGAVPKLSSTWHTAPSHVSPSPAPTDDIAGLSTTSRGAEEGVSFESPVQIDTLHSANKTRAKVANKRRPPTRMGRKLASQDSDTDDIRDQPPNSSSTNPQSAETGHSQSVHGLERNVSSMKLSLSENDMQSEPRSVLVAKPLTPDVNDLFGNSDLFAKSPLPTATTSNSIDVSSAINKAVQEIAKESTALGDKGSDDDLFRPIKHKSKKAIEPAAGVLDADLFGGPTFQKNESKSASSNIFEHDIFASEDTKPVKKPKGTKSAPEPNLFDDENLDIFADLTQKPKEKKTKKKVEPKSIFDDDMDDIFSSGSLKKSKPKIQKNFPTKETKLDPGANAFDDPLNVLGK
ncbi:WASH complex subunit 2A isoform X2 [Bombina bombina]|uniref:WASH complex subunit 2A isoform X2 n=1 Tax=Bombina bombina TaxID=8345 RepID=UPI00235AA848|nr:WASH complex subunit 2A isoform X2 [Bombina bombina]